MELEKAQNIAIKVKAALEPHCERIEIAGSIRREKPKVKDIEIVAIPKPYETGLFQNGVASIINQWQKVKGELPCRYTQRMLPEGIKLDLFFATEINWGLIYAIRTGSAEYSHNTLAVSWTKKGYKSIDGNLTYQGKVVPVYEEIDLFKRLGLEYLPPKLRN